jgi:flagellar basal-body rod protein FlgC
MSWLSGLSVAGSGVRASSLRMDIIAQNIANADATRTPEGGPYHRQVVLLGSAVTSPIPAFGGADAGPDAGGGVQIEGITDAPDPIRRVYNPGHPDADAQGYVQMPNVDLPMEMADLTVASRVYQANVAAMQTIRRSLNEAVNMLG